MTEQEEIDTLRLVSRFFAFSERGEPFKKTFNTNGERMTEQEEIDTLRSVSRVFAFSDRGEPFKKTFSFEGKTVERMVMEVGFAEYNERGSLLCKKGPGNDEAWYEYDEHGKKTHSRRHGGLTDKGKEFWYDRQGRVTREKDDDGNEAWHEYDERGNEIHLKTSDGFEEWHEYDEAGNAVSHRNSDGCEERHEYDGHGMEIHCKSSDGFEEWREYNEYGSIIHRKTVKPQGISRARWYGGLEDVDYRIRAKKSKRQRKSRGHDESEQTGPVVCEIWIEYDERGNIIHRKSSDGFEEWREYDEYGSIIHHKTVKPQGISREWWYDGLEDGDYWIRRGIRNRQRKSRGHDESEQTGPVVCETWIEYDERGNIIHRKNSDGFEEWREYDERGNIIHRRNSDGYDGWFEYNDAGQPLREKHVFPAASKHNAFSAAVRSCAKQERKKYEASLPHAAAQKAARDAQDESSDIEEVLYEYDEGGRLLSKISDDGAERHEYDERGNETYRMVRRFGRIPPKDYAEETWYEYDDCGRVIRKRNSLFERCYDYGKDGMTETIREYYHHSGMEHWIETERWANGKQKRRAEYMAATKKNPDIQIEL